MGVCSDFWGHLKEGLMQSPSLTKQQFWQENVKTKILQGYNELDMIQCFLKYGGEVNTPLFWGAGFCNPI